MSLSGVDSFAVFGGIGIGLVWGWLVALVIRRMRSPLLTLFSMGFASLLLAIEVRWLLGEMEMMIAGGAALFSFAIHTILLYGWSKHLNIHH